MTGNINIPAGSSLVVNMPTDYTGLLATGSYACQVTTWPTTFPTPICNINGIVITITNLFPTLLSASSPVLIIIVNNIINPPFATTTDVFTGLIQSSGVTIYTLDT